MSVQTIAVLLIQLSIFLTVFALALDTRLEQTLFLLHHPARLLRSLAAMSLVMPLFVMALAALIPLPPVVKVALVAISVSPVPPILPGKLLKLGASEDHVISLLVIAALSAIILVPVIVAIFGFIYGVEARTDVEKIASTVFRSVLLPLAAGVAVRRWWPYMADVLKRPCALAGPVLLAVTAIALLGALWPLIASLAGSGAIWAFTLFVIAGLAAGHLMGGPEPGDRTVLAFAAASRHPGVAAGVAAANFPDTKLALAAIFLYLLVSLIVPIPYTLWRKRRAKAPPAYASGHRPKATGF